MPLQNEPTLLEFFYEIRRQNNNAPTKLIVNLLINDFLMMCHKNKVDVDEWYGLDFVVCADIFVLFR